MDLFLLFIAVVAAFVFICVAAAKLYPRFSGQSEAEAEADVTGVAPDAGRVKPGENLGG